jgi:hypothetical protein
MTMLNMIAEAKQKHDDWQWRRDFIAAAALLMTSRTVDEAGQKAQFARVSDNVRQMFVKAAQPGAVTSNSGLDFGTLLGAFMRGVRNVGVFDRIAEFAFPMPLSAGRVVIASAVSSSKVAEGKAKPVRPITWLANDVDPVKIVSLVVLSRELLEGLTEPGLQMLDRELRDAVAVGADAELLSALDANSSESPSASPTFSGFVDDLVELVRLVSAGSTSKLFLVLRPDACKAIAVQAINVGITTLGWNGGTLAGIEVLVSDAQTEMRATLIDATGLAIGSTRLGLRSSAEGTIEMDTAPNQASDTGTAANQVSLFQTGSVGLLAERAILVKPIRNNSYAHLTNLAFPAIDSPLG